MIDLFEIYKGIISEGVDINKVNDAINNHIVINVKYNDEEPDAKTLKRTIYVYAYGLTIAGNPVIRAYQTFGDSKRGKPAWKMFRLDRFLSWEPTRQQFWKPINELDPNAPVYNPNGDKSMQVVYNQIDFNKPIKKLKKLETTETI